MKVQPNGNNKASLPMVIEQTRHEDYKCSKPIDLINKVAEY